MVASLAFCNDCDFMTWQAYREVHGVLKDFGFPAQDSFWLFSSDPTDMALYQRSPKEKGPRYDELMEEIRGGQLSILHGGGNYGKGGGGLRPGRQLLADGLATLRASALVPKTWTNHGDESDIQNMGGALPKYQEGDSPAAEVYALDLLRGHGVRFFWMDRHYSNDQFAFSLTPGKPNPLLTMESTRSGYPVVCFYRYRGALRKAPDAQTLGWQLSAANLEQLADSDGAVIVYQHWGVHRDSEGRPFPARSPVFSEESLQGLLRLSRMRDLGRLRVVKLEMLLMDAEKALLGRGREVT